MGRVKVIKELGVAGMDYEELADGIVVLRSTLTVLIACIIKILLTSPTLLWNMTCSST